MTIRYAASVLLALWLTSTAASAHAGNRYRMGHSTHGPAFNEGPRTRPTTLDGIGRTHFPITTRNPEVQAWFDQRNYTRTSLDTHGPAIWTANPAPRLDALDPTLANTRRFKSYDDFEQMPIHSTLLIDRQGRIHWGRHGGDPFEDVAFLQAQLRRMNTSQRPASAPPTASK